MIISEENTQEYCVEKPLGNKFKVECRICSVQFHCCRSCSPQTRFHLEGLFKNSCEIILVLWDKKKKKGEQFESAILQKFVVE